MEENLEDIERAVMVLLDNARGVLYELKERTEKGSVDFSLLLDVQAVFLLGLSDASLYAFALEHDELVEEAYETFVEGYQLIKDNGLMFNNEELDLQLGFLQNLDLKRGFSLDRRLSILGRPREIQVWVNRIIKLRNALHGSLPREPLREIGYRMEESDRRFPLLLRVVRRIYKMRSPSVEELSTLLYLEMKLDLEATSLPCRDGHCEEITEIGELSGFEKVVSGDIEVYYNFANGKRITSPWGQVNLGTPVEIVVFSRRKNRGFRCLREAV
jgi:hypothetical protein